MNLDEHRERQKDDQEWFGNLQLPALWPAVNAFIEYKTQCNRRPEYLKTLRNYLRRFIKGREAEPVSAITDQDVERWLRDRNESPNARCAGMGRLGSFFTWAKRRKLITTSPLEGMERPTIEWRVPQILTPKQMRRLLTSARRHSPQWVPYLVLGGMLGIRPEEMTRLTWDKIHLGRGLVTIDSDVSKVRLRRLVPIHPKAAAWLSKYQGAPGQRIHNSSRVSPHMTKLAALAGFKWSHDILRHTAASYQMALHQDAGKVSRWLGNSITILQKHYLELIGPEDCRRFWKCSFEKKPARTNQATVAPSVIPLAPTTVWVDFGSMTRTA